MTRIRKEHRETTIEYRELARSASELEEKNDCGVKALALAAGISYKRARVLLAREGRRTGGSTQTRSILYCLRHLGFKTESVYDFRSYLESLPGRRRNHMTTHHPVRFRKQFRAWSKGQTHLLFTKGHVLAVKNDEVHDWSRGRSLRVYMAIRIVGRVGEPR